jgi:acylpyruvate hydrolase
MRFASVVHDGNEVAVAIEGDRALPLVGFSELGTDTPLSALLEAHLDRTTTLPLDEVRYRAVVPNPRKVICVGLNYLEHIEETGREVPDYPVLFTKFANTLTGPFDEIPCPPESSAIDYEVELTVVIGKPARRVSREDALSYVAGITVANDISMRDYQSKTHQWLQGKSWEATTPVGPTLVTLDEAGDLGALTLRTTVNGKVVQEASTSLMIFDVPTLVSTISEFTTLEPGDLILTGTPSGVGMQRDPPLLLKAGDVVSVEIDGIGRIQNTFV